MRDLEEIEDPYEVILKKMREYPNDIPVNTNGNISEAFREYIKLMFTPVEAEIAQHLEIKTQNIYEIAKRIGKERKETKKILKEMADKGIIQDIGGYSYFLTVAHLFNIGFKFSKALERFGKKGAELYQQFFIKEKYYKRYESSDAGTPLTRIIPVNASVDHQSQISNAEEIHGIIEECQDPIVVTDCPCRNRTDLLGERECKDKYPIKETCFQLGPFGHYFVKRGEGKVLSREEAHQVVDKLANLGLIFTTENVKVANHVLVCCCCECCCAFLRGVTRFEDKNDNCVARSNYIAKVNEDLCEGCGLCEKRCVFKAVTLIDEISSVNSTKCYGCGACAVTCPTRAIRLHREERSIIFGTHKELTETIYKENRI